MTVVGGTGLRACLGAAGLLLGLLSLCLSVKDVLLGCTESGFDFLDGRFDRRDVLSLVCVLKLGQRSFDGRLLVSGNLVAKFLKLFFSLEDDRVCLVDGVDTFLFL